MIFSNLRKKLLIRFLGLLFVTIIGLTLTIPNNDTTKKLDNPWALQAKTRCANLTERGQANTCFRTVLREMTKAEGVGQAVQIFSILRQEEIIDARFDDHLLVHEIGRAAAEFFDISPDNFLNCPTTFNYGCQHGFFEYTLSKADSPKDAATVICEAIPTDRPPKLYYYCYHGVGHGLMMALAYNLGQSLDICDELPSQRATEACWQGVLMENSNVAITEEERVFGFTKDDPLAPCNKLEEKYQWQCFLNHGGYLSKITNLNVKEAAKICLSAGKGATPCLQSLGLMTTNPIWQKSILNVDSISDPQKNAEAAWQLCQLMPPEAQKDCVIGAVGNIHNFDETQTVRSESFCSLVNKDLASVCFQEVGRSVSSQANNISEAASICKKLKNQTAQTKCLSGITNLSSQEEELLLKDDKFLKRLIKEAGPAAVIDKLAIIAPAYNQSCHDRAHEAGRLAYELSGADAFKTCSSSCHSGCYHGAAEAFFHDKGTANLEKNIEVICQGEKNRFFSHQCLHGVGHGLAAWANYEIFEALGICDRLSANEAQASCWTGVFMENIVGGLSLTLKEGGKNFSSDRHYTKYLSANPHYPCNIVPDKYRGACYFLQTSRMLQLYGSDFEKIARECTQVASSYQSDCFQSMGRDVSGTSKPDIELAIKQCQLAPAGMPRSECLSGAAQDFFWDPSGRDPAITFCSRLTDNREAARCWEIITNRASEVLSEADYKSFCQIIPQKIEIPCKEKTSFALLPRQQTLGQQNNTHELSINTQIVIKDEGFTPQKLVIKKNTIIVFKNGGENLHWPASNIHPTHRIYPEFDPQKPIGKGKSWNFKFDKAGIWQFHDHLYPDLTGNIEVIE